MNWTIFKTDTDYRCIYNGEEPIGFTEEEGARKYVALRLEMDAARAAALDPRATCNGAPVLGTGRVQVDALALGLLHQEREQTQSSKAPVTANTCGTCKHRGKEILIPDYKNWTNDKPSGYFQCDFIKHNDKSVYEGRFLKGQKACVVDGSDYYAALCVEDDFGCNLWEAA